ncbi:MAG: membrane integrity-associated transporter subunit PqiC [Desulfuromonadales bacterium]|nr:MAG: membrane integrity-associated transporter subunit PqiC [Desulfuromonadales bacterium]
MLRGSSLTRTLFLVAVAALVAACGTSPPARMYTLSSLGTQEVKSAGQQGAKPVSVSIAPVEVPDYLDRSQIVTRDGTNGLKFAEFDRWGGSLGENMTSVLVENLSILLASDRVFAYPRLRPEKPDYWVGVRILRLDCVPGDRVELKAQWLVTSGLETQDVARRVSIFTERVSDGSYETLVAAVSRTVGQLSREITREIATQRPGVVAGSAGQQ